jgi:hypothetical protein
MYKQNRILPPGGDEQSPPSPEPVPMTSGMQPPEPVVRRAATPPAIFVVVGVGLVALCVALSAVVVSRVGTREATEPTALPQPVMALVQPTAAVPTTPPATPTPSCTAATSYMEIITRQEQANRWEEAVATAETGLADTRLCSSDRKLFTARAVVDGLRVLYTKPFDPLDVAAQQQEVDRYLALRQRAHDAQVSFDTPLQVAGQAYQIGQFPLVRVAIEQALADGDYHPEVDRAMTRMYISTLYNMGSWYTQAPAGSALYQQGLACLAASHQLAVKYQTGQGEAAMLLRQLVSQQESGWPAPAQTPLLNVK